MNELDILMQALAVSADNAILRSHVAHLQYEAERYEEAYANYKFLYDKIFYDAILENTENFLQQP